MRHATNRVKGFYAKTNKPARLNMFVGLAWRLPRLIVGEAGRSLRPRFDYPRKRRLLNVPLEDAASAVPNGIKNQAFNPLPTFNKQLSAFPAHATFPYLPCPRGGMADAEGLKIQNGQLASSRTES